MPIKKPDQEINLESLENFKKFILNREENKKTDIPKIKNKFIFDENEKINDFSNLKKFTNENEEMEDLNFDIFEEKPNKIETDNNDITPEEEIFNEYSLKETNKNKNLYDEEPQIKDIINENLTNINKYGKINPLLKYKDPGISIKLPSLGFFYDESIISMEIGKEINIYPMTAKDEVLIRTPDFLLNGSAIEMIIKNCCPSVHNVKKLLTNDIIAILLGIRWASYSENLPIESICPSCKKENNIQINIPFLFDNMTYLKKEYIYNLKGKLQIYLKPFTYDLILKTAIVSFEESKIFQIIEKENVDDNEKIRLARKALEKIQEVGIYCLSRSIIKIITENRETITDINMIEEWIKTLKLKDFNELRDFVAELNGIGLPTRIMTKCVHCNHEYELDVKYDPASFFE